MSALEGIPVEVQANQIKGSPGLPGKLRSGCPSYEDEPQDSSLAVLPKSEQQPNAPGLLFWFLLL